jgi:hypothetical protein
MLLILAVLAGRLRLRGSALGIFCTKGRRVCVHSIMFAAPLTAQMCDMEALHSSFGPFQQRQAHTPGTAFWFFAAFGTLPGLVDRPDKIPFAIQPFTVGVQRTPPAKTAIVECEIEEATPW